MQRARLTRRCSGAQIGRSGSRSPRAQRRGSALLPRAGYGGKGGDAEACGTTLEQGEIETRTRTHQFTVVSNSDDLYKVHRLTPPSFISLCEKNRFLSKPTAYSLLKKQRDRSVGLWGLTGKPRGRVRHLNTHHHSSKKHGPLNIWPPFIHLLAPAIIFFSARFAWVLCGCTQLYSDIHIHKK